MLAGSALHQPLYDFSGQQIPASDLAYFLSCTLLPTTTGGVAILAWHYVFDQQIRPFVQSLLNLPKDRISDGLIHLVFSYFENQVASPDWWESLPAEHRDQLLGTLQNNALPHKNFPPKPPDGSDLLPGSKRFSDWSFQSSLWI